MKNLNTYESFGINENTERLTPAENAVIDLIKKKNKSIVITATDKNPGAGEFYVTLSGKRDGINFEGKLMLTAIRELVDWTKPEVAKMTDYPKMAMDGDWSAVRDSSNIEGIFAKFVVNNLKVMDLAKKQEYIGESAGSTSDIKLKVDGKDYEIKFQNRTKKSSTTGEMVDVNIFNTTSLALSMTPNQFIQFSAEISKVANELKNNKKIK